MSSTIKVIKDTSIKYPDKIALVINDERITYNEFYDEIKAFAGCLIEKGIKKGNYVVVKAWCSKYYFISMYGTILAGGIFVPLEKDYTSSQIEALNEEFGGIFMLVSNDLDSSLGESLLLIIAGRHMPTTKREGNKVVKKCLTFFIINPLLIIKLFILYHAFMRV